MAEVKLRLNLDAGEVELVVDGQVALSSGPEVFANWVEAYNEKHKPVVEPVAPAAPVVEALVSVEEPVVEAPVTPEAPVVEVTETPTVEVETNTSE
jgi:hypothetical protein